MEQIRQHFENIKSNTSLGLSWTLHYLHILRDNLTLIALVRDNGNTKDLRRLKSLFANYFNKFEQKQHPPYVIVYNLSKMITSNTIFSNIKPLEGEYREYLVDNAARLLQYYIEEIEIELHKQQKPTITGHIIGRGSH